jgi:hypothetical protein
MISKEKSKAKLIPVLTLIAGLILGSFVILLSDYRLGKISTDEAGKKVKALYELTFGGNVEVISTIEENGQECLDAKVKIAPSIVYQKEVYEGTKTIEWFENKTGCKF